MAVNINVARLSITVPIFCRYNVSFQIIMQQYIVIATMGLLVNLVDVNIVIQNRVFIIGFIVREHYTHLFLLWMPIM